MPMALSMAPLHLLGQDDCNEVQNKFSGHVIGTDVGIIWSTSIIKGATQFLASRQSTWGGTWHFWSCDIIAIAIGITWCHWFWCHVMPLASVSVSHDAYSIINGTITFLGKHEWQHDFLGHMIPLALASVSCDLNRILNGTFALLRSTW